MAQLSLNETDPLAVSINGQPATVAAWLHPVPSKDWVVLLGGTSVGFAICVSEESCSRMAIRAPPVPTQPGPGQHHVLLTQVYSCCLILA